jgi:hypothetical protein
VAAPDVRQAAGHPDVHWVSTRGALEQVVRGVRARPGVAEISMENRQASGQQKAAEPREDSRERLAGADSNSVLVEPWEEQPGVRLSVLRLPAPEKLRAEASHAVSILPAPEGLQVLQARLEQPEDAQRIWRPQVAEQHVPA